MNKYFNFMEVMLLSVTCLFGGDQEDLNVKLANAVANKDAKCVKSLLLDGAVANLQVEGGLTILMAAAMQGDLQMVTLLLDFGAQVNVKNSYGQTELMLAAFSGDVAIVQALLDASANVHATDKNGSDAKGYALSRGHKEIADLLDQAPIYGTRFKNTCYFLIVLWIICISLFIWNRKRLYKLEKIEVLGLRRLYRDLLWSFLFGFLLILTTLSFRFSGLGLAHSIGLALGSTFGLFFVRTFFYFFFWWWKPAHFQDKPARNGVCILFYVYTIMTWVSIIAGFGQGMLGSFGSIFSLVMFFLIYHKYSTLKRLVKTIESQPA